MKCCARCKTPYGCAMQGCNCHYDNGHNESEWNEHLKKQEALRIEADRASRQPTNLKNEKWFANYGR